MRMGSFLRILGLVAVFSLLAASAARADELYGRIRGVVTDASGASVPEAKVTVTNVATGISRDVATSSEGSYEFLSLPIGTYKLSVTKTDFKTFTATGIVLAVNQVYVQNAKMELGAVSQEVVVEAAPAQVETTSMQLGTVITGQQIVDLPLNGRNWVQLQQLQPGVVASSDRFGSNFSTNGSQTQQNSYLINGVDSNDLPLNTPLVIPSPDAIQEFQLVTNTINPEYGRNSGGILNAVVKSGTNKFHGDAFEFFRDTSLNARKFFLRKPDVFHQNQFGGTIGGPVWKDHTFFFFSYQGTRFRQAQRGGVVTVFSQAQRNGVFPELSTSSGSSPIPLFGDSASGCPVSGGTPCPAGTAYSSLFSTGVVPSQDFNKISVNLLNTFVPLPNSGTEFTFNPFTTGSTDQELFRIDHTFNTHDSIWGYGFFSRSPSTDTLPFTGSDLPGFPELAKRDIKQFTGAWNHTFSGSTLNEFRAGYTRFNFVAVQPVKPVLPSSFGFAINPQNPAVAGVPVIAVTGFFSLGFTDNGPQPRIDQTYQITDNFSKIAGRHTVKLGFEGRKFQVSNPFFFVNGGHFDFGGIGSFSTGSPAADFLLGFPDDYFQSSGGFIDAQSFEYYSYLQDQYKVRPNLTLTYGIGWQVDTPLNDRFNKSRAINCFRPVQQSTVFPTSPSGLVFPGDAGCNSAGYITHYNNFGPRFGFAYSPDLGWVSGGPGKLSIRGGIGVYYNRSEEEVTLQNLLAPPFSLIDFGVSDVGGNPSFAAPFSDIACIDQNGNPIAGCVPSGPSASIANKFPFSPPAPGSPVDFTFFEPFSLNVLDPNFKVPTATNYNLTVERELPGRMILSVGYVGAVAHHLVGAYELNPGINPTGCATPSASNPLDKKSGLTLCERFRSFQNLVFPGNFKFPGNIYGSVGNQGTYGNSNYNSLQVSLNKHVSHGLYFLAAYTYSHSLDFGSSFENASFGPLGQNPFNFQRDYGDSQFDARQRFVLSYGYDIPSIRRFHAFEFIPSRITDGWRFAGITTFQTGFPVVISDSAARSLTCVPAFSFYACPDRPNVVAALKTLDPRTGTVGTKIHLFFDPRGFAREAFGTFGNVSRNPFHGPGIDNFDFQLSKETRITEGTRVEMRVELFNIWNHAQFNNPIGNINSGNFGRVLSSKDPRLVQLAAKFYF